MYRFAYINHERHRFSNKSNVSHNNPLFCIVPCGSIKTRPCFVFCFVLFCFCLFFSFARLFACSFVCLFVCLGFFSLPVSSKSLTGKITKNPARNSLTEMTLEISVKSGLMEPYSIFVRVYEWVICSILTANIWWISTNNIGFLRKMLYTAWSTFPCITDMYLARFINLIKYRCIASPRGCIVYKRPGVVNSYPTFLKKMISTFNYIVLVNHVVRKALNYFNTLYSVLRYSSVAVLSRISLAEFTLPTTPIS